MTTKGDYLTDHSGRRIWLFGKSKDRALYTKDDDDYQIMEQWSENRIGMMKRFNRHERAVERKLDEILELLRYRQRC